MFVRNRHIVSLFSMIILFGIVFSNIISVRYYHIHVDMDGRVVMHSHPNSDNSSNPNNPAHKHSDISYLVCDILSNHNETTISCIGIPEVSSIDRCLEFIELPAVSFNAVFSFHYGLRAPPLL